jgi:outer membrane lipoprotein-sorting protein
VRGRPALALAVLGLLSGGCVAGRLPEPTAGWPPAPPAEAEPLLAGLAAREQAVQAARGLAQVTASAPGLRRRFVQALVIQRPDRFRIEVLAVGATPLWLAASDGREMQIHAVARREFAQGPSEPAALQEVTGFAMEPAMLVRLLLGLPPWPAPASAVLRAAPDGAERDLRWEGPEGRVRLTLDGDPPRPAAGWLESPALGEVAFAFGEYGEVDGLAWPGRVVVRRPADGIEVEVRYQSVEVNPPIGPGTFRLDPPRDPGTVRRHWDGGRR